MSARVLQRLTASCLASPSTKKSTSRARLNRAALNDTRCGGGLGASNTANTSRACGARTVQKYERQVAVE